VDAVAKNVATVREFTRIFKNQHNADGIDHLFAPTFQHHFAPPIEPGLRGLKDVGRMMNTAFPDVVVTEEDLIVAGDKVVERSSAKATHRGAFMGRSPTGKHVAWTEIHIYQIANGKIIAHWAEWAILGLLQQIDG
jgi:predicted ester cyclase